MNAMPRLDQSRSTATAYHSANEWLAIIRIDFENGGSRPRLPRKPANRLDEKQSRGMML
jgi:hypothetical protein